MIHSIIEWWCDLDRRGKYLFCLSILGFNIFLFFTGTVSFTSWAVGVVLLICTFLKIGED
jgi:hypothetical protein